MQRNKRICLAWHNLNSANYGVGALSIAHLSMIIEAADKNNVKLTIDTLGTSNHSNLFIKEEVEKRYNIQIKHINYGLRDLYNQIIRLDFSPLLAFKKYDIVFDIGEGDSFTDIYGIKRFIIQSFTKILSLFSKAQLVISPQTVGPFNRRVSLAIANQILKRASAIYARDNKSGDLLRSCGIKNEVVSDMAFNLPYDHGETIKDSVGINVSGLLWNGGYNNNNQFNLSVNYRELTLKLIDGFLSRGKKVYLIGHVITDDIEVEDDYRVCCHIQKIYNDGVFLAPKFSSPIAAKSFISRTEFFIGARMHATIAALSSGVPVIPIGYSRKFSGVFGSINYNYTLEAYGCTDTETILSQCFKLYDEKFDEMKYQANISSNIAKDNNKKYISYLNELLK